MKALLFALLSFLTIQTYGQQSLTNQDVISLVKAGMSADIVIAKIKQTGGDFETSPATMKALKDAGVPESIILAMIEAGAVKGPEAIATIESARSLPSRIKDGTRIEIELASTVSSADLMEGDAVSFLAVQAVKVDGRTVIERGASATARVVKAEGGKRWGRSGQLSWAIQNITAVDGTKIPLHFDTGTNGGGQPGPVTIGVVATGLLYWPAAPLRGFKKGKPAVIPAGKRFEVFASGDSVVNAMSAPRRSTIPSRQTNGPKSKSCYFAGQKIPCP